MCLDLFGPVSEFGLLNKMVNKLFWFWFWNQQDSFMNMFADRSISDEKIEMVFLFVCLFDVKSLDKARQLLLGNYHRCLG